MSDPISWSEHFGSDETPRQTKTPNGAAAMVAGLLVKVALLGLSFYLGLLSVDALFPFSVDHGIIQYLWCSLLSCSAIVGQAAIKTDRPD